MMKRLPRGAAFLSSISTGLVAGIALGRSHLFHLKYEVIPSMASEQSVMSLIRFETKLFKIGSWTILKLPKSASVKLPSRGQVMVKGTINGLQFQTALEPDGNGSHWFRVGKDMQTSTKAEAGDMVTLAIESTKEWPEPSVPADWKAALDAHPRVQERWMDITPMARWEWIRWIGSTSKSETRSRRIDVACSKLMAGERRPCCFNRNVCCVPEVSKNGVLLEPAATREPSI